MVRKIIIRRIFTPSFQTFLGKTKMYYSMVADDGGKILRVIHMDGGGGGGVIRQTKNDRIITVP